VKVAALRKYVSRLFRMAFALACMARSQMSDWVRIHYMIGKIS